jgi:hypothetical protein
LTTEDTPLDDSKEAFYATMDCLGKDIQANFDTHPVSYAKLDTAQQVDSAIKKELQKDNCKYHIKDFHGGGITRSLVCYKDKIVVPTQLQKTCD